MPRRSCLAGCLALLLVCGSAWAADPGHLPQNPDGRPLNLDFESGDLRDWTPDGEAFSGQPIKGDTVSSRREDMSSNHQGDYWIGGFEPKGADDAVGTLTSAPFKVTKPFASFLIGGGSHKDTRVELLLAGGDKPFAQVTGQESETMRRVVVDLTSYQGKDIIVRLVDRHLGPWGHLNFDDFRLHDDKPQAATPSGEASPDDYLHAGLSPEEAAKAMTVPEGFSVKLFAGEPDVTQPIAMALDDRGRLWVAEGHTYPRRAAEGEGRDRIVIFEDTNGDGHFDERKLFAEKLNLVSGIAVGFGGVWVGAAPYLMFIPDANGDDVPDGEPKILLDGWGYEDTHETLNTFIWGPDGWLYGCHGVFTHSRVGKPGTPDDQRQPINAGIWRYHPVRHEFEVFAYGTSNPWGVDFNDRGQAFLTSCVIPHLYHVVQGARYERQGGVHFNPHTYDDIKTVADHRHYVGANPHGGNNKSDSAGGGHAHAGAMIYLGGSWPQKYRGQIFMNNIHGQRINMDTLKPQGSGYVGSHGPDFLLTGDRWSQILNLIYGPDGQVYMIDWYDENACHHGNPEGHDRSNGRIFKVVYQNTPAVKVDLAKLSDEELVKLQQSDNDWYVRHGRRVLQERAAAGKIAAATPAALAKLATTDKEETRRLRGLWALQVVGGFTQQIAKQALADPSPYVRSWAIQLASETPGDAAALAPELARLAAEDPSPVVRLYIASALQRMPLASRWDVLAPLLNHVEDAGDHNLPLMYWYALEPLAEVDPARALALAESSPIPPLAMFMARRVGALDLAGKSAPALVLEHAAAADTSARRLALLQGLNAALAGRPRVSTPESWPREKLLGDADPKVVAEVRKLAVTFGDRQAIAELKATLADRQSTLASRREALTALLRIREAGLGQELRKLLGEPGLRAAALRGLASYDDSETPAAILAGYAEYTLPEKRDALNTLAARPAYAQALLDAVAAGKVPSSDLSAELVRQMLNLGDVAVKERVDKVWGAVRESTGDKAEQIEAYHWLLNAKPSYTPDLALGRALFAKTCAQCHTLFATGGKVGPDLTGSNRANRDYLLSNVLDPSAVMAKEYMPSIIATSDGRVITGIVRSETPDALTVQTANELITLPRGEIDTLEPAQTSMMPDDILKPLSDDEVRSLVAYLASPRQTPMLATADNAANLFNGTDLTGWTGDPAIWSVEDGELVGKTQGIDHNEFLLSDLAVGDFRLTCDVKLTPNAANSGIQFRSESLPEGEVKGYQADIGAGWWGKLYEEHGRGLLWDHSGEAHLKPDDWNHYEIVAVGGQIRTFLNGKPCVDLEDPEGAKRGILAIQVHAGGPTEVRFKNFKLEVLGGAGGAPGREVGGSRR